MNLYIKKPHFSWRKIIISGLILILVIGFLNIFDSPIKNTFYKLTSPITQTFWKVGDSVSGFFSSFFRVRFLSQENKDLQSENQRLLAEITLLQEIAKENQLIGQALDNTKKDNVDLLLAQTIGLEGDFVLLNKGSDDGILENMPVISAQKVLFGKVFKVYKNFSKVMLISDKNSVVDAKMQSLDLTKPPVLGIIKGDGNLSVYMDLISSDAQINQEDVIITSGQEGIFPRGLLIGNIAGSEKNDAKPFQTARVLPFFDAINTHDLFVITNYLRKPQ